MRDMMSAFSLEGKVAWITGACYGIGMAIAKALAYAGAKIAVNGKNPEHVEAALSEYRAEGLAVYGRVCDVTDVTSIINMILETDVTNPIADVNESGIIDVSDVTTVINHILN